ncbi:hypothetical protein ACSIJM_24225, partial [Vibrio parahaemolyticus]
IFHRCHDLGVGRALRLFGSVILLGGGGSLGIRFCLLSLAASTSSASPLGRSRFIRLLIRGGFWCR